MVQPKYKFGQEVKYTIKTTHKESGTEFTNEVIGKISVILAAGTSEKDSYNYGITTDMPRCYHSGKKPFEFIMEDSIVLNK